MASGDFVHGTTGSVTFLAHRLAEKARLFMPLLTIFDLHEPGSLLSVLPPSQGDSALAIRTRG